MFQRKILHLISEAKILFSIIKDISKQIELEKEIQEEKERYKNLTNYSSDAIFILNIEDGKIIKNNDENNLHKIIFIGGWWS